MDPYMWAGAVVEEFGQESERLELILQAQLEVARHRLNCARNDAELLAARAGFRLALNRLSAFMLRGVAPEELRPPSDAA